MWLPDKYTNQYLVYKEDGAGGNGCRVGNQYFLSPSILEIIISMKIVVSIH